jgi:predicted dehydrogenase
MKTAPPPLRVALLGCGQIADAHLQEIRKLPAAQLVAVCDTYADLARQAAARFDVPAACDNLDRMLDEARPDVVHVTTPAHTHCALAIRLLQRGCHVYVEKPLTLDVAECDRLLAVAAEHGRCVTVGHDQLFDPIWLECRRRVEAGEIGDVRHVESVLGYALSGQFGSLVASDPDHCVHRLPGGLFHNTISHPLYRITDLIAEESFAVDAQWFARKEQFPTELRVQLKGRHATASLIFDTGIAPQRVTHICGSRGTLEVDLDAQVIRTRRQPRMPGALGRLETPFRHWRESARNLRRNVWRFVRSDMHYFAGLRELSRRFYAAIQSGGEPPIPYAEIRRVTALMDEIFDQCRERDEAERERSEDRSQRPAARGQWSEVRGQKTEIGGRMAMPSERDSEISNPRFQI